MDYTCSNLAKLEGNTISENREATPTKIGVHAYDINPYLHEFYELILLNSIFSLPWTQNNGNKSMVHGLKGKTGLI